MRCQEREGGFQEVLAKGIEQGKYRQLVLIVQRKLQKGLSADEIAELLEEDKERAQDIIDSLKNRKKKHQEDYDEREVTD